MSAPFKIVSATRSNEQSFKTLALGKSLHSFSAFSMQTRIFFDNGKGLPTCYNQAIRESTNPEIIVFVHDDVHFLDLFWREHLMVGLSHFDVIGVAGDRRRVPRQPSWAFVDDNFTWDALSYLGGVVAHGNNFPFSVSVYGPPLQRCTLLDGLMLAARAKTLSDLYFDERFQFHFAIWISVVRRN